jgi:hypothetical protein
MKNATIRQLADQVTKMHQRQTICILILVGFGVFVIWWQNLTFRGLNFEH